MKFAAIGIAMGRGSDVALKPVAMQHLPPNQLCELAGMIQLSHTIRNNIRQNITIALRLKAIFLVNRLFRITGL
ncbi:MAG: hypothetical protein ACSLEL_01075 [Candidatus Malihini olakiniferum]